MARADEEKNQDKLNPEAKFMRLQEVGLSMILAIPVAIAAGEAFFINDALIVQICVLLFYIGFAFFVLGHEKRKEIRKQ